MAKRGPRPTYDRIGPNKVGAPLFSTRLDVPIFHHIKAHPEGPRQYIERLVTEDVERTGTGLLGQPKGVAPDSAP